MSDLLPPMPCNGILALASAPLSPHEFALQCNSVMDVHNLGDNFLPFEYHLYTDIYIKLVSQARNLSEGKYLLQEGWGCCSVLIGATKNIRTCCLQDFVQFCPKVVPNVYTIYVNYGNNMEYLGQESIVTVIITELNRMGLQINQTAVSECPKDALLGYLQTNQVNVLVLLDEFEHIYRRQDGTSMCTLHALAALGRQHTGRISVVVTGSSTVIEALLTCSTDPAIRCEFPLLGGGAPTLDFTAMLCRSAAGAAEPLASRTDTAESCVAAHTQGCFASLIAFVCCCCSGRNT